jgi:hypothetical protein
MRSLEATMNPWIELVLFLVFIVAVLALIGFVVWEHETRIRRRR